MATRRLISFLASISAALLTAPAPAAANARDYGPLADVIAIRSSLPRDEDRVAAWVHVYGDFAEVVVESKGAYTFGLRRAEGWKTRHVDDLASKGSARAFPPATLACFKRLDLP